jgi:N-acetylmuramoyl-L-alanine amidase
VRFSSIALAFCALLAFVPAADAGQLTGWQMSNDGRKLSFKTDSGVQPKAWLLFAPTRVVIDLPGTTFPRPTVTQNLSGYYNTLRVGQFDASTTRLVLEVRSGYTLSPRQISINGSNPIDWSVDILSNPVVGNMPSS